MSIVSAIYDARTTWVIADTEKGEVSVGLEFSGNQYSGHARLHPNDKDFFSYKVGRQIATSRARIQILRAEMNKAKQTYNNKYAFYQEVTGFGSRAPAEIDPTGTLLRNVIRSQRRVDFLKEALNDEENNLRDYLEGQAKAIASVQRFRNKDRDNNS